MRFGEIPKIRFASAKRAAETISAAVKSAAPSGDHALEWARRQQTIAMAHLPDARRIEEWAQANAARFGWREKPSSNSLEHLEATLTQVIAAVLQTSDGHAQKLVTAAIGKLGGIATVGGITSLVAAFGTAGNGAAIAGLSGAALNSAQLYWVGSWLGMGAAAGGVILTAGGAGVGVLAAMLGRRHMFGRSRSEKNIQEHEKTILVACLALIKAIQKQTRAGTAPTAAEMRQVAEHALIPLAYQIDQHWDDATLKENGITECQSFTRTLAYLPRRKLDRCRTELGRIALAAMARDASR